MSFVVATRTGENQQTVTWNQVWGQRWSGVPSLSAPNYGRHRQQNETNKVARRLIALDIVVSVI